MKKWTFVFSLLATSLGILSFKPTSGGKTGTVFPEMICENYHGKDVTLPTSTNGKFTLIGVAFSASAQNDLESWMSPIYNTFIQKKDPNNIFDPRVEYDVNLYLIPMFTKAKQAVSKKAKAKIRQETDEELYDNLLFYVGAKTYKEELGLTDKSKPYFFILNKAGKIVYADSGKYSEAKFDKIIDILDAG